MVAAHAQKSRSYRHSWAHLLIPRALVLAPEALAVEIAGSAFSLWCVQMFALDTREGAQAVDGRTVCNREDK